MSEEQNSTPAAGQGKGFLKKRDLIIIAVFLAVAALVFGLWQYQKKKTQNERIWAVVSYGDMNLFGVNLSEVEEEQDIDLNTLLGLPAVLHVKDHKICFKEVVCPDKICEAYGYIGDSAMDIAVCMPNNLAIVTYTEAEYLQLKEAEQAAMEERIRQYEEEQQQAVQNGEVPSGSLEE